MDENVTVADGMRVLWDVAIEMDDGVVLRADVFLPEREGRYPVILNHGPYAKGLAFQEGYKSRWDDMIAAYPEVLSGSTSKYQNWEVVDPEKWCPGGYACLRIDSRGAGRSPGVIENWSPRETKDLYDCIEWAAGQPWCSGKVGMNGISYFAMNQWHVASLQPPHLAALCIWEGAADYYRDVGRHGGIKSGFLDSWFEEWIVPRQHGRGERAPRSVVTGELIAGPETEADEVLRTRRVDPAQEVLKRPLDGSYYRERSPDYSKITVPLLSSANWGGMGMHSRGNFEGYLDAASDQKWLEVHGDTHYDPFYRDEGVRLQKRFFGHFLKGDDTGWDRQPPVQLQIRHRGEDFRIRDEQEWPLARTQWTRFHLDPGSRELCEAPATGAPVAFDAAGQGVTFVLPSVAKELEITGPVAAKLFVSSDTGGADLFLALRLFAPDGREELFIGTNAPQVPIALGWLRASQRKLDPGRSLPYRPFHSHDEPWPLTPGEPVELDIEIWPTCIVVPPGYRLALNIRGNDFDHGLNPGGPAGGGLRPTGVGPFTHDDPEDRPPVVFGGRTSLHFEQGREPFLIPPVIPPRLATRLAGEPA